MRLRSLLALPALLPLLLPVAHCGGQVGAAADGGADGPVATVPRDAGKPDVALPPRPEPKTGEVVVIELGSVPAGVPFTFQIPDNALGFNLVGKRGGPGTVLGVESLVSPTGKTVLSGHVPAGGTTETTISESGIVAAEAPQTDAAGAMPFERGTWKATFSADGPVEASVRVQTTADGVFHGGMIDMHVYVPPGLVSDGAVLSSAAQAEKDPGIAERLDAFFALARLRFDLDRGKISFHAVPSSFATISSETELTKAFALGGSAGTADGTQALHVILTNDILGGEAWGIAPGIPGAHTRTGTPMSSVVLSLIGPADLDGVALFHEVGHFLGLNHTSEFVPGLFDPLSDTPRCLDIDPNDPMKLLACPDVKNFMFPTVGTTFDRVTVEKSQAIVFDSSPAIRAYLDETQRKLRPPAPPMKDVHGELPMRLRMGARCVSGRLSRK
jgi:hypothetical protein